MNDEIKEILDDLKNYANEGGEHNLMEYEIKHIQCYITNLQKEKEDYKSRCEKANEYIMSNLITEWNIKNGGDVSGSDLPADEIIPILNILNGGDEE